MESTAKMTLGTDLGLGSNSEIEGRYLTFWIDRQLFGIPIAEVVQIVGVQPITAIPEYPYYAKGIISLRGAIIPVIDVRLRLNKPGAEYDDRTCIIVINFRERNYGLVVDEVEEVVDIDDKDISAPPQMMDSTGAERYITGIGHREKDVLLLLDTAQLIGSEYEAANWDV